MSETERQVLTGLQELLKTSPVEGFGNVLIPGEVAQVLSDSPCADPLEGTHLTLLPLNPYGGGIYFGQYKIMLRPKN